MPKPKSRKKKTPKRVLTLPDLEHAKTAVLNSLASASAFTTAAFVATNAPISRGMRFVRIADSVTSTRAIAPLTTI